MTWLSLFAGLDLASGMECLRDHGARLGALPQLRVADIIDTIARSGLRGRGGAAFPVAEKWRGVLANERSGAVVLANGAEGEPLSRKDRVLMETRPHLVLDGALLAAGAVNAREILLYVASDFTAAQSSLQRAIAQRTADEASRMRILRAPRRYVAGEESAAVHFVNDGLALPTATRPHQRGVGGRATLVHNVETLAHVAMIARFGDAWFGDLGRGDSAGTALLTVSGAVAAPGVVEVAQGSTVADAVAAAGGPRGVSGALLLGGYFGGWVSASDAWELLVDASAMRARGHLLGTGVIAVLPDQRCGVVETARIAAWLAEQSARQCGPCVFGLRAIASALERIAAGTSVVDDLDHIRRWTGELPGRGACRHPDGAAGLVGSALRVFADEFELHHRHRRCGGVASAAEAA